MVWTDRRRKADPEPPSRPRAPRVIVDRSPRLAGAVTKTTLALALGLAGCAPKDAPVCQPVFSYATPTNNPEVLSRIWFVNKTCTVYTILGETVGAPALLSDNGIQRQYQYTARGSACTGVVGSLDVTNVIAIKGNVGLIL